MRWSGGMLVLAAVCMLGSGCVSTPASRIKANPSLFASFPPQVQEQVRKGAVAVGFTEDMVRMALGDPDRVILRTTAALQTKIWVYTDVRYSSRMEPIEAGYWYHDRAGRLRRATDLGWRDVEYRHEYPVMKVELEDGKVKAIEKFR